MKAVSGVGREAKKRAGKRTVARRLALQLLYEHDIRGEIDERRISVFLRHFAPEGYVNRYVQRLISGVFVHRKELDAVISSLCRRWRYERISPVERSILRMGAYEMLHGDDVPPKTAIDEAVELAKRFATKEAASFVNGILHSLAVKEGLLDQSPQQ